ncbi:hypothetical protein F4677DRAFT_445422 [Hypoxylon crocopeplum]|nr:hypothetical protein F4677DRAFT_445422 [Hypoxylon crocopeplum]
MKAFTFVAFASPILAAAIKGRALDQPIDSITTSLNGTHVLDDDIRVLCGAPSDYPNTEFSAYDYSYPVGLLLSGGSRRIHVDAGPRKCKQAACNANGGAGVFICNDQHNPIDVLYTDAGFFAQRVYEKCKHRRDGTDYVQKGQAFCPQNWNVILADVGKVCTASTLPNSD